jgi:hypothetical protein
MGKLERNIALPTDGNSGIGAWHGKRVRRRDQRPVADDNRRLRRKAPGGFRRNGEATTHEWRCRPSFQSAMLANNLMAKETA